MSSNFIDVVDNLCCHVTQGNKKLDKAEILEMTIEYLQRIQQQGIRPSGGTVYLCDDDDMLIC